MADEPTFSPDGKFMWNGSEWIPSPPGYSPSTETNVVLEDDNKGVELELVTESRQVLIDQVSQLVDSLETDHNNYVAQKKAIIPPFIFTIIFAFFMINYGQKPTQDQADAFFMNALIIYLVIGIPVNIASRRYYGLNGVKGVSIFALSSKIKIIDPMMQKLETHEKMPIYVEICAAVRSNMIGKIILGSIGAAVGAGALAVIASQMKNQSK